MRGSWFPKLFLLVAVIAGCVLHGKVAAQEKKEPPSRPVNVEPSDSSRALAEKKLPKIDLPEYVITGRERIDLPSSRKLDQGGGQGTYLDPSRLTNVGDKESEELLRLSQKLGASLFGGSRSFDGKLNLGYGRFDLKYGEGWYGRRFAEGDFDLHGSYQARDAYVEHSEATVGSFDASAGLYLPKRLELLGGSKISGQFGYEGEKYRFFGGPNPSLERTLDNVQVGLNLQSRSAAPLKYESWVHFRRLTVRDKDQSREDDLSLGLRTNGDVGGWQLRGEFSFDGDFLDQSIVGKDPNYLKAAGGFRKLFGNLDLSGEMDYYLYRNSDSDFISKFYPNLLVQYYLNPDLTLFAQFNPSVERNSLLRAISENRYIGNDVQINHQDVYVDVAGGIQFDILNRGTARVYFRYQRVRGFPLYVDPSVLYYVMIFPTPYADWALRYDGITRLSSLNGDILVDLTQLDRLSGTVTIRSTHNSLTDSEVPYNAPVTITGSYAHQFPFGLSTQVDVRFVGERQIALSEGLSLTSYSVVDASFEYSFIKDFSVFLHLNNVFDQHYATWNRYEEVPFSLLGGLSVKW
jgi:outer membrane receptor protein involved in Fe transport